MRKDIECEKKIETRTHNLTGVKPKGIRKLECIYYTTI